MNLQVQVQQHINDQTTSNTNGVTKSPTASSSGSQGAVAQLDDTGRGMSGNIRHPEGCLWKNNNPLPSLLPKQFHKENCAVRIKWAYSWECLYLTQIPLSGKTTVVANAQQRTDERVLVLTMKFEIPQQPLKI